MHRCDPVLTATGSSGPLTHARAMRLLLTYFHEQALDGDARPVLEDIGNCDLCMFAVTTQLLHFSASLIWDTPDRQRRQLVALLEQQLVAALDQLAAEGGGDAAVG
ncbi:hypothetical protein [Mycolicibacterium grossiae]|nr:hypothetical protein [Mycolicibacterium grossiae]QEM46302.1 hypothetical protein FZ046_17365 [Mycolicibacterium grossiae]